MNDTNKGAAPLVGVVMGSDSDWPVMRHTVRQLELFSIAHEYRVVSAHRTPDLLFEYAATAQRRGLQCIIAGAGGAAHLPGMLAAKTPLPVLGVPIPSRHLHGRDSLYSIVQMPGGIPVATFAIGEPGAINAGLFAVAMLACFNADHRGTAQAVSPDAKPDGAQYGTASRRMMCPLPIRPGAMLGILGGGQLGRLFTQSALAMGYRVSVLDPDPLSPAGQVATRHLQTAYTDCAALDFIAQNCAAVSIEFESIPAEALHALRGRVRLAPSAAAVEIAQDRLFEKQFIRDCGLATARFYPVLRAADSTAAFDHIGGEGILKTARLGYDGKGQAICRDHAELEAAFARFAAVPCVLEEKVDLRTELSVVLARSDDGVVACFPVAENAHVGGILDISVVPAQVDALLSAEAQRLATSLADALDYTGVLGVELFVTTDGRVLVNEIAPRPHNSGHYTLDAAVTSQFEQQVRMLCGLPAGDTALTSPAAMLNLLGDLWTLGEPNWLAVLPPSAALHLYGKAQARVGRKMGHINVLADSAARALAIARGIKIELSR